MKFVSSLAISALLGQSSAWWGNGHLLVSRIAQELLEKESPETVEQVENILSVLKQSDPSWTKKEEKHIMVECVTFADDIKYKGGGYQSGWHFIDTPYLDQGGSIDDFNFTPDAHNVTETITSLNAWFNKEDGYEDTYQYQQIMSHGLKTKTDMDALSTAMRLLLHYVGDIHQPLHATSRVNNDYPEGDRGGNSFNLPSKMGAKNLHSVWDSVAYAQAGDFNLPFSDSDWESISNTAKELIAKYDVEQSVAEDIDPVHWANDSFEISSTFLYKDINEGEELADEYIQQAVPLAEKQLVIAGHRLASLLLSLNLEQWQTEAEIPTLKTRIESLFN